MAPTAQIYVGVDLGGARGKTTAVARLSNCSEGPIVEEVLPRGPGNVPWIDDRIVEYLQILGADTTVAINAPLTMPACVRCTLAQCPGEAACVDPAVIWLRTAAASIVETALEQEATGSSRTSPHTKSSQRAIPRSRARLVPYRQRCSEVDLHYNRGLIPRETLGKGTTLVASRGAYLRKRLTSIGFQLNRTLLEVSPRATVHALFGAYKAQGYKRDADPWQTRASIIDGLSDLQFSPRSRFSKEEVLSNDHCFEALLSAYSAYLVHQQGQTLPEDDASVFAMDGWIWVPDGSNV